MPQKLAGIRSDPPPSLPVATGHRYAATAAAAPPLDPPGVRSVSHGLCPRIPREFSHVPTMPNSGTLVFPSITAPAFKTLSTKAAFRSGTRFSYTTDPMVVRTPAVIWVSLTGTGRPCSAPSLSPRITASSAARACSIAKSRVSRIKELSCGSSRSMRSKNISASSTGETCFVAISSSNSVAGSYASRSSAITLPPPHLSALDTHARACSH